nr:ATP binding cassette subfamily D member 3 [Nephromyces sp. MMRI]
MGSNGSGKSSLFRILGELWPLKGGIVTKPDPIHIFYVPQRPYLPKGTLREQIIYPDTKRTFLKKGFDDSYLIQLLKDVSLSYILTKRAHSNFDYILNWDEALSGGEKQKLAIARIAYHNPIFAILDEATSAVSVDLEGFLYSYLINKGITLITISHRLHLLRFHYYLLKIEIGGTWSFETINNKQIPRLESYSNLMK